LRVNKGEIGLLAGGDRPDTAAPETLRRALGGPAQRVLVARGRRATVDVDLVAEW